MSLKQITEQFAKAVNRAVQDESLYELAAADAKLRQAGGAPAVLHIFGFCVGHLVKEGVNPRLLIDFVEVITRLNSDINPLHARTP